MGRWHLLLVLVASTGGVVDGHVDAVVRAEVHHAQVVVLAGCQLLEVSRGNEHGHGAGNGTGPPDLDGRGRAVCGRDWLAVALWHRRMGVLELGLR